MVCGRLFQTLSSRYCILSAVFLWVDFIWPRKSFYGVCCRILNLYTLDFYCSGSKRQTIKYIFWKSENWTLTLINILWQFHDNSISIVCKLDRRSYRSFPVFTGSSKSTALIGLKGRLECKLLKKAVNLTNGTCLIELQMISYNLWNF